MIDTDKRARDLVVGDTIRDADLDGPLYITEIGGHGDTVLIAGVGADSDDIQRTFDGDECAEVLPSGRLYDFLDGRICATFEKDGAIVPEEAVSAVAAAIVAAGGELMQDFVPHEQERKGDPGFIGADFRVALPFGGPLVWIEIECPTDQALED